MNKKVNITTNGLLIDGEWAVYLVKGANWITISVNAATKEIHEIINKGSDFYKVLDNIKKLVSLKYSVGANVNIIFHYTIVPENIHEMIDAIELADNLGCDIINYSYDISVPPLFEADKKLMTKTTNALIQLTNSKELNIKIDTNRLEYLGVTNENVYNSIRRTNVLLDNSLY